VESGKSSRRRKKNLECWKGEEGKDDVTSRGKKTQVRKERLKRRAILGGKEPKDEGCKGKRQKAWWDKTVCP